MIRGEKQYLAAPLVMMRMEPSGKLLPLVIQVRCSGHSPFQLCSMFNSTSGLGPRNPASWLLAPKFHPHAGRHVLMSLLACSLISPDSPNWKYLFKSHNGLLEFSSHTQWFSNFSVHQNRLKGLLKHKLLGPTTRFSDSVDLGWRLRICISNKFQSNADAASLEIHVENCYIISQ